ncbi:MAG: hypothetical protein IIC39_09655 [Candidatus Marinimicrobia bacterium]|nr:hypothetical protein [Candidatus Neomarinimicrobiota bacterium]
MATRQKILLVLLGLSASYYFYDLLSGDGEGGISNIPVVKNFPVSILPLQDKTEQVQQAVLLSPGEGNLSVSYIGELLNDPFYNLQFLELLSKTSDGEFVEIDAQDSSLILSGIVDEWAIIGGEIYELNSEVKGYKLVEIGEEYAILKSGNTKLRLELGGIEENE